MPGAHFSRASAHSSGRSEEDQLSAVNNRIHASIDVDAEVQLPVAKSAVADITLRVQDRAPRVNTSGGHLSSGDAFPLIGQMCGFECRFLSALPGD